MPDIQRANMAVFALDENSTILISDETYNVNFNVSLYYPNDKVTEARIVGIKNGDPSTIKTLQEGITEFPIKMKLSYQDLKSKFGEIVEGDQIELGMDIKWELFGSQLLDQMGNQLLLQMLLAYLVPIQPLP